LRIIVAADKFKDCLSAPKVAEAIAAGLKLADPYAQIDLCPMGDGGEGTVDALVKATNGKFVTQGVTGPIPGTIVGATMGFLGDGTTAVIEMAAASGLHLLRPDERNPMKTTTYGTGELIKRALEEGAKEIILGIGGLVMALGAQNLIRDLISGIAILLEDTMGIGDQVVINPNGLSGEVTRMGARIVRLKGANSEVHQIAYSSITSVTNLTQR